MSAVSVSDFQMVVDLVVVLVVILAFAPVLCLWSSYFSHSSSGGDGGGRGGASLLKSIKSFDPLNGWRSLLLATYYYGSK